MGGKAFRDTIVEKGKQRFIFLHSGYQRWWSYMLERHSGSETGRGGEDCWSVVCDISCVNMRFQYARNSCMALLYGMQARWIFIKSHICSIVYCMSPPTKTISAPFAPARFRALPLTTKLSSFQETGTLRHEFETDAQIFQSGQCMDM